MTYLRHEGASQAYDNAADSEDFSAEMYGIQDSDVNEDDDVGNMTIRASDTTSPLPHIDLSLLTVSSECSYACCLYWATTHILCTLQIPSYYVSD